MGGRIRQFVLLMAAVFTVGCSRTYYRQSADKETYSALGERLVDPRWDLPRVAIDTAPRSRLFDPYHPDHPPLPPDDPAAHRYMHLADGHKGYRKWHKDGDAPWIEAPHWKEFLNQTEDGALNLTPERSIELGLLHSREYQTALEEVYLSALALTLDRFQFDLQWFGRNSTNGFHFGRGANESNSLSTATNLGFNKAFTGGAQLLVEFANSWVWEFTGPTRGVTTSNIAVNLVQPLLRNGGRDFRMERLTQAERSVLYAVRDFARFRKQYSVDVAIRGYLSLLLQLQSIRNQEANLSSLNQSLRFHEGLFDAGRVSAVEVEQVFQNLQAARLSLLQQQNRLDTALDDFKILLGLPPSLKVQLDDGLLDQFQLNDPALVKFQDVLVAFLDEYRRVKTTPSLKELQEAFRKLRMYHTQAVQTAGQVTKEIANWKEQLSARGGDQEQLKRLLRDQSEMATKHLPAIRADLDQLAKEIATAAVDLTEETRNEGLSSLYRRTTALIDIAVRLTNFQTQVRAYLIRLRPIPYQVEEATEYALEARLDLMNRRGRVTDAWRQITVAANALEANLDVSASANFATVPGGTNPLDLNARASSYRVGLAFDSPLNRQNERNTYRATLVNYQRARRAFMDLDDRIQRAIRLDVRNLETERLNFEIARQSLISAVRQLRAAYARQLLADNIDPVSTLNVLNALNSVLAARNTLIGSWVNFETGRIQLLLDMELLQLDARGYFTDEPRHEPDSLPAPRPLAPTNQPSK